MCCEIENRYVKDLDSCTIRQLVRLQFPFDGFRRLRRTRARRIDGIAPPLAFGTTLDRTSATVNRSAPGRRGTLLESLNRPVDAQHTVLFIQHHLDVIKTADYVDLGPEGGHAGGEVVVAGTPEEVAACKASQSGQISPRTLAGITVGVPPSRNTGYGSMPIG